MQSKSIHNPARTENVQTKTTFPAFGDNFATITVLDDVTDPMALMEAIDFLDDCAVALSAFMADEDRTGTPKTP